MVATGDTSDEARRHLDALLRRMTPAEKFRRVLALAEISRGLALSRMRERHPELDADELRRRRAVDLLPPELARIMRERAAR